MSGAKFTSLLLCHCGRDLNYPLLGIKLESDYSQLKQTKINSKKPDEKSILQQNNHLSSSPFNSYMSIHSNKNRCLNYPVIKCLPNIATQFITRKPANAPYLSSKYMLLISFIFSTQHQLYWMLDVKRKGIRNQTEKNFKS